MNLTTANRIGIVVLIVLAGFFSSTWYHYYWSQYIGLGYPFTTFLFQPGDVFRDYLVHYNQSVGLDPYKYNSTAGLVANYFPFAYAFMAPFLLFSYETSSRVFFFVCALIFALIVSHAIIKAKLEASREFKVLTVICLVCFSYPVLFCFDRLNIEFIPFFCAYLFTIFERKGKLYQAYFFLSLAVMIKPYYILFGLIGLDRDFLYKSLKLSGGLLTVSIISFLILRRPVLDNMRLLLLGLAKSSSIFDAERPLFFSSSLLEVFRYLSTLYPSMIGLKGMITLKGIFVLSAVTLLVPLIFIVFNKYTYYWMKLLAVAAYVIISTHVSFDYKLIIMYIPLVWYFRDENPDSKFSYFMGVLMAIMLIPKDYIYLYKGTDISISTLINPILLMVIIIALFIYSLLKPKNPKVIEQT